LSFVPTSKISSEFFNQTGDTVRYMELACVTGDSSFANILFPNKQFNDGTSSVLFHLNIVNGQNCSSWHGNKTGWTV